MGQWSLYQATEPPTPRVSKSRRKRYLCACQKMLLECRPSIGSVRANGAWASARPLQRRASGGGGTCRGEAGELQQQHGGPQRGEGQGQRGTPARRAGHGRAARRLRRRTARYSAATHPGCGVDTRKTPTPEGRMPNLGRLGTSPALPGSLNGPGRFFRNAQKESALWRPNSHLRVFS